jgi:hypothetical protein
MSYSEFWRPNRITTDITFLKSLEQHTRNGAIYNQWAARPNDSNIVLMADLLNDNTNTHIYKLIKIGAISTTLDSYTQQADPRSIKRSLGIGIRPWLITLIPDGRVEELIAGTRLGPIFDGEINNFIAGKASTSYPDMHWTVANFLRAMRERPRTIPIVAMSGKFAAVATVDGMSLRS